ncbi:glycosyltransferase family 4 protein [Paenibacillus arenilitoris]|uniref:Glycosyltransferase family 4 protein n=1 Tax=Paenibacillus arenilitoris TaxID=2772299 RepID=A0A927H5R6_9BACL|nr:glycosyltransferase family 4 protein [Paenibacillus arenilitoris]MBD2868712.1 glycosyltransferase family 4 protein [Paenibacillus arenilitoris]
MLKIAQISTNTITVPPKAYGGTQRDIHYLTEELVRRGHHVVLFAKKGSTAQATETFEYPTNDPEEQLEFIMSNLPDDVDIIHDHYGIVAKANPPIPTIRNSHSKGVTGVQIPVYVSKTILKRFGKNRGYYVHNGIRVNDYAFRKKKRSYLLFLGRLIEQKGVHLAIKVAQKTGKELIIAGTLNDRNYFNTQIKPHLNKRIRYVGPVGGKTKMNLLANASCVLFTSTWNEPFGLVLIEALASGTPVLGFKKGAVPEVLKGLPQLLCSNTKEMILKVKNHAGFPSAYRCRHYVRAHFSDSVMTDNFLKLYDKVIKGKKYKIIKNSTWNKKLKKIQNKELE